VQREQSKDKPPSSAPRIFLIHATSLAIGPIAESFAENWPAARLSNLLDDSLAGDLQKAGKLEAPMVERFVALSSYASNAGADAILFTCSAFGSAIDTCKSTFALPILKPNEAMIDKALEAGRRIALLATFAPALESMAQEFRDRAHVVGASPVLRTIHVPDAFAAIQLGDSATHDARIVECARGVVDCDLICFAQFSMARAAEAASRASGISVMTTPKTAVEKLRRLVAAQ
jgi:aspartate/glutamate racemase